MDTNESANKMIKIDLGKEGKFLSGRSRANDIVGKLANDQLSTSSIELNFSDVESCSQSFLSELIYRLKEKGVRPGTVKSSGATDNEVKERLNAELQRLEMA